MIQVQARTQLKLIEGEGYEAARIHWGKRVRKET